MRAGEGIIEVHINWLISKLWKILSRDWRGTVFSALLNISPLHET